MPGAEKVVTEVSKAFADILKRASTPARFGASILGRLACSGVIFGAVYRSSWKL